MNLLLDTHILLWFMNNDKKLPKEAAQLILATENRILVSAASFWEIGLKMTLGKISVSLNELRESILECEFELLSIKAEHAIHVHTLRYYHRDPFDRMLIAQSLIEPAILVTTDKMLQHYGETVMLV